MQVSLLLIASFVALLSFIYGHVTVANWLHERFTRTEFSKRLLQVATLVVSLTLTLVPSYRSHDIVQQGLLPFGILSHLFLTLMITWYVLVSGLGLWQLLQEYYVLFVRRRGR